jgi:carbonic anhydrase
VHDLADLFANNRRWAADVRARQPDFFSGLAAQQTPKYLWIGCSDSRVPANEIVALMPGELFVHRNVANVVVHTDLNCLSVLQFAVDVLRVEHVIVCGHYGCGGVQAAMRDDRLGLIDNWLLHLRDLYRRHAPALDAVADAQARFDRFCELNVFEQAVNVGNTTVVRDVWARGQALSVHAVIYGLTDGLLKPLDVALTCERDVTAAADAMGQRVLGGG